MFIAVRDLVHARERFLLMGFVIALVAYLVTFLSGLSAGLISNNVSGLMALPVSHFVCMADDRPTFRSSLVDRQMWEGWAGKPRVRQPTPIGHTTFNGRGEANGPLEFVLWGLTPGSYLDPPVAEGRALLRDVGMDHRENRRPAELSGGERQRVGIARALMSDPALMLVDEPTSMLDHTLGRQVTELLARECHQRRVATLMVTHDPAMLESVDRVVSIIDGRLSDGRGGTHAAH
jgi:hypothetical protein